VPHTHTSIMSKAPRIIHDWGTISSVKRKANRQEMMVPGTSNVNHVQVRRVVSSPRPPRLVRRKAITREDTPRPEPPYAKVTRGYNVQVCDVHKPVPETPPHVYLEASDDEQDNASTPPLQIQDPPPLRPIIAHDDMDAKVYSKNDTIIFAKSIARQFLQHLLRSDDWEREFDKKFTYAKVQGMVNNNLHMLADVAESQPAARSDSSDVYTE